MTAAGAEAPIGLADAAAWSAALADVPHAYWHTHAACAALAAGRDEPIFLHRLTAGATIAIDAYAVRRHGTATDRYVPAGFAGAVCVGDPAPVRARRVAAAAATGDVCGYYPLHPLLAAPEAHDGVRDTGNTLFAIDLRDGADAALARFDRSARRSLRAFDGTFRRVGDRPRIAAFLQAEYAAFMARHGANPAAVWPAATLAAFCADPAVRLVAAEDRDGLCAAYAFASTPHAAEALVHVSVRDGREATSALVAWGVETLAAQGVPWLHLGGGVRADDAIARAKRKFGPVERPMRVACEVYRPDAFAALCAARGDATPSGTGYFPPYRAPRQTESL